MNDSEFWLKLWKYILITFCVVLTLSLANCQVSKYQITSAIKAGSSAMEAACAFNHASIHADALCGITVMNTQNKSKELKNVSEE